MASRSAGILLYRLKNKNLEVLLVHPGGPFWTKKDEGAWTIPKGEINEDEDPLKAAIRELEEETGIVVNGDFIELLPIKQKSGKLVYAWALEHDFDAANIKSNTFEMEWPPRSGKKKTFPEVNKAEWFGIEEGKKKIIAAQAALLEELSEKFKVK